ncbi:SDR family oxidoreductase [Thalassotalea sp. HSM 43]|uniref:SDR family oxidoreductase n=1 Tax=Thalassotalea sp. HSM 43 TaxID=2552945 RepID=UPI001081C317|nr:SDR family oxidoreductase [Thalassotalea sp. HSM 43]QBY04535.1 SDR family oxidoreductase [Thalassotalea sp. HSM 43]
MRLGELANGNQASKAAEQVKIQQRDSGVASEIGSEIDSEIENGMESKIALVTGANRGIGLAIASKLAALGMTVVMTGRDQQKLQQETRKLQAQGLTVVAKVLDVTDAKQCSDLISAIAEQYGRLDVLINNAGIAIDQWVPGCEVAMELVEQTIATNVYGPLALTQAALTVMKRQQHGRIVNISSQLASFSAMTMGMTLAYRMSKTALNSMTKILSMELGEYPDIKINAVAMAWVKTDLGGPEAPLLPKQAAETPVWLATLEHDGPTGELFQDSKPFAW